MYLKLPWNVQNVEIFHQTLINSLKTNFLFENTSSSIIIRPLDCVFNISRYCKSLEIALIDCNLGLFPK